MKIPLSSQLARIQQASTANRSNPAKPQPTQPSTATDAPTPKQVAEISSRIRELEPAVPPLIAADDPVFNTPDAAQILGVRADRLIKWRQRRQGPEYLQYEHRGPVRYELSALIAFKAAHRVRPSRQPHPGRRGSR